MDIGQAFTHSWSEWEVMSLGITLTFLKRASSGTQKSHSWSPLPQEPGHRWPHRCGIWGLEAANVQTMAKPQFKSQLCSSPVAPKGSFVCVCFVFLFCQGLASQWCEE